MRHAERLTTKRCQFWEESRATTATGQTVREKRDKEQIVA